MLHALLQTLLTYPLDSSLGVLFLTYIIIKLEAALGANLYGQTLGGGGKI